MVGEFVRPQRLLIFITRAMIAWDATQPDDGSARAAEKCDKQTSGTYRLHDNLEAPMAGPVHALNLFNVADRDKYLAYSRRSAEEVQAHGGRVVALGKFRETAAGNIKPRTVMILVEWASKAAFDGYCNDPKIADLHPHREKGARHGATPNAATCSTRYSRTSTHPAPK